jgi:hypothetical protein
MCSRATSLSEAWGSLRLIHYVQCSNLNIIAMYGVCVNEDGHLLLVTEPSERTLRQAIADGNVSFNKRSASS